MTIKELKELIKDLPDEMLCVTQMYSNARHLEPPTITEVILKRNGSEVVFESYYKMQHPKGAMTPVKVLYFEGN